jgi:predicted flap endonuclease-1-like 5' DNA nuclease
MQGFLLFCLGLIAGVGLHWYLHDRYRKEDTSAREAQHAAQLKALQEEVRQADAAHNETKQRLIALQFERGQPVDGALPAAADSGRADDLTRIKGIGKVIEKKLHDLGITSLHQLAELQPGEVQRINAAIDFPGRVEREHWIEQARSMTGR